MPTLPSRGDLSILPVPERIVRCPIAAPSDRFPDAPAVRCVLEDEHRGVCKLINGQPLTSAVQSPAQRYRVMGYPVPERLLVLERLAATRAAPRRAAAPGWVVAVAIAAGLSVGLFALLELARAAGWVR